MIGSPVEYSETLKTNMYSGPSGTVKLAKKETTKPAASAEKKPAAAKVPWSRHQLGLTCVD